MSRLIELLKKQGGVRLLKQYLKGGALVTALVEFILLGRDRTSLEILRLSANLKIYRRIRKKYLPLLKEFDMRYDVGLPHVQSNKVWVCWFQGIENAPTVVKKCYMSLKKNLEGYDVTLISESNMQDYVDFPDFIIKKWNEGLITHTHMTDLLRLELLIKYGGTWVDSTVFCSRKIENIPNFYFDSDLFFFQTLKPGKDGHATVISSWYINATSNNRVLMAARFLLYQYWKKNNWMIDYFLLHDFVQMVLEYYIDDWKNVIPVSNSESHILLLRFFDHYDKKMLDSILSQVPFHKLSYKFSEEQTEKEGTYYRWFCDTTSFGSNIWEY